MHRVQKTPIYYDHIRKDQPRVRQSVVDKSGIGSTNGLLLKLLTTIKNKDKIKRRSSRVPSPSPGEEREEYHHHLHQHHNQDKHDLHLKAMKAEQRLMLANQRKFRMHDTYEFHLPRPRDIFSILRKQ